MKPIHKVLLFILLPLVAVLLFPPATLLSSPGVLLFAVVAFALLGWMLWQGRNWALLLMIFLQGFNVIIRLMLFLSTTVDKNGVFNLPFLLTSLAAMALSLWLLLRLDRADIRQMIYR